MNTDLKITSSINPNDIDKVMSIVATFGADKENDIQNSVIQITNSIMKK